MPYRFVLYRSKNNTRREGSEGLRFAPMGKIFHFDPLVLAKNALIRCNICTTKFVVRLNNDKIFLVENCVPFLCDFHRNTVDFEQKYRIPR